MLNVDVRPTGSNFSLLGADGCRPKLLLNPWSRLLKAQRLDHRE